MTIITFFGFVLCCVLAIPAALFIRRFPLDVQRNAATKAIFLWFFATSPVFAAIFMSKPDAATDISEHVQSGALSSVSFTEVFVYTASFVSPLLYLIFDFLKRLKNLKSIRDLQQLIHNMRGMPWIILSSLVLLGITLLSYGSAKADPEGFPETVMAQLLTDRGWMVYIVSLLIWYCVILWEQDPEFSFERKEKKKANNFSENYAKRRSQEP